MKYTDAQIKAINQGRNPAIVSAGAGSGKTRVLTRSDSACRKADMRQKREYRPVKNRCGNIYGKGGG